jgi:hypothetical protein
MKIPSEKSLLGRWRTDPSDVESLRTFGRVTLDFSEDGSLTYTAHLEDKNQVILLTYSIDDGLLITDQPSHPERQQTPFRIEHDGRLTLSYDNCDSHYIRESGE